MKTVGIFSATVMLAILFASTVYGADISVDEDCSLADAIIAANRDTATGGCPAGDGGDTIKLSADVTLGAELPRVSTEIILEGGGYSISGDSVFRIFYVVTSGKLTIERLTILGGRAGDEVAPGKWGEDGGAIYSEGELSVSRSRFADNTANDGGAIFNWGELSINDSIFSDNSVDQDGGAILNAGVLSISNSAFSSNQADDDGGAIHNFEELSINGSTFAGNSADQDGGAIYNFGGLRIIGSIISDNSADGGGAIYNSHGGELSVIGGTLTGNSAYYRGGAYYNEGELNIEDSRFSDNSASVGGAIHNEKDLIVKNGTLSGNAAHIGGAINNLGDLSVQSSTFSGNLAGSGGAINNSAIDSPGELSVINSIFTGNSASGGGAISNDGKLTVVDSQFAQNSAYFFGGTIASLGTLIVSNSTFHNNAADKIDDSTGSDDSVVSVGGSLFIAGDEMHRSIATLEHVTMAQNSAQGDGSSIYVHSTDFAIVNLRNSIIEGNSGGECLGPLADSFGNLIEDGSCNAELSGDPMLGELVEPDDGSPAYYPLQWDSPAIDAAIADFCSDTDQIGTERPQGAACDIGAIEYVLEE